MDCALSTLHTLIACFSWSGLYVDGGVEVRDSSDDWALYKERVVNIYWPENPVPTEYRFPETSRTRFAENPYGRVSIGYQLQFSETTWSLEASHTSSLENSHDRGYNSLSLRVRWFPFR
jgi:hypothetical protein